jgi:hypothetical protein
MRREKINHYGGRSTTFYDFGRISTSGNCSRSHALPVLARFYAIAKSARLPCNFEVAMTVPNVDQHACGYGHNQQ